MKLNCGRLISGLCLFQKYLFAFLKMIKQMIVLLKRKKRVKQVVVYLRDVEKEENNSDTDRVCLYGQKKAINYGKKVFKDTFLKCLKGLKKTYFLFV